MKANKVITTLIPLFLLFCSITFFSSNSSANNNVETYSSNNIFTGGSWIILEIEDSGIQSIGKIRAEWILKDSEGNVIYKWVHTPDAWQSSLTGGWRAYDKFEIQLPNMWFYPEGEWTIEGQFKSDITDFNPTVFVYKFNVEHGNWIDNLFAPIYLYKGFKIFGFEVSNFHAILPPIGYLLMPILVLIAVFLVIRYIRFTYKEGKKFISLSSYKIKRELGTGEKNE